MKKSPAFLHYPSDDLSSIEYQALSWAGKGLFHHLRNLMWANGEDQFWLPNDDKTRRVVGATKELWEEVAHVFVFEDNRIVCPHLMARKMERSEISRKAKASIKKRWDNERNTDELPTNNEGNTRAMNYIALEDEDSLKSLNLNLKEVYEHWNKEGVTNHRRLTEKMVGHIRSKLQDFSVAEIKTAISNYATVLRSPDHWLDYRWTLDEFLSRHNGFVKFTSENDPFTNYRRNESGFGDRPTPTQRSFKALESLRGKAKSKAGKPKELTP